MITQSNNDIGQRLLDLQRALQLSAKSLGQRLGVVGGTILSIEHGYTKFPSVDFIRRLRQVEGAYQNEIGLYKQGIHPKFYLTTKVNRPSDISEMGRVGAVGPGGTKAGGMGVTARKILPVETRTRLLAPRSYPSRRGNAGGPKIETGRPKTV